MTTQIKLTDYQKLQLCGMATLLVEALPEHTPIVGNALDSGDPIIDKKCENEIIRQLESGNEWAWCTVKVTNSFAGFMGTDYLGACSYKSKQDFIVSDDYFSDMVSRSFDELVEEIETSLNNADLLKLLAMKYEI